MVRADLPTGTVTFLFSDVEGSTRLLYELGEAGYAEALAAHRQVLREAFVAHGGVEVNTEGDAFFVAFPTAPGALAAARDGLAALADGPIAVRMGIHTGTPLVTEESYVGVDVHRAARIAAAGHGGQVLVSAATAALVPPEKGVQLLDLGEHRLKDLTRAEHVFQLVHPRLPSDFPPLATLSHRPNNLPVQASEFLGRESQLSAIRDLLDTPGMRLLTLTGPGGIGKTRLALQGAAEQIERFQDGVYFVDLAPVRDQDAAFQAVVRAVEVSAPGDEPPLEVLKVELRALHMLLLLDNFEQVVDAADGVAELLGHCPNLRVLVTSREALRVRGEHLFPVPPMSLPDDRDTQPSAELLTGYDAVRLFVERAREVFPSFALTDENAGSVAEICARLDGLPLAIELAAARLTVFSTDDLRDRLRARLDVLRGGPRDLPTRQQTLRNTIEWSYELLDDEERAIFAVLSVFSHANVEAVEGVVARLEPVREADVVDRLSSLVHKSLVRSLEGPGARRLSMLETIREYAAERLAEEAALGVAAKRAHAEYFAELAQSRRDSLYGPARDETLDDLAAEIGNLLTAWRYWVDAGDLEQLDRLLDGVWMLCDARGWYHAAVALTNDLLGVLSAAPSTPDRAREEITLRTSLARGLLAIRGYTEEVEETYGRALALAQEAGELPQRFEVLRSLATFHLYRAEFEKAAAIGRELLNLAAQEDEAGLAVEGHLVLGSNLAFLGDIPAGLDHLSRAISLFDPHRHGSGRFRLGPSPGVVPHTTSAFLLWLLGSPDRAVERAARAVELARQLDHPFTVAYALFHVGFLDLWRQDLELVHERASSVLEVAEEHDYHVWRALALVLRGVAKTGLGRPEEGLAETDRGIALYQGLQTPPIFWPVVLFVRAQGLAFGGQSAEGLQSIAEAIEMTGGGTILDPEFALLRGDLVLAAPDADGAEQWFRRGFDLAAQMGARTPQLRAATRLTRLHRELGKRSDTSNTLRGVYETFTEGFDTPDLVEARALLDELDVPVA